MSPSERGTGSLSLRSWTLRSPQPLLQSIHVFTETGRGSVVSRGWEQRGVDARFLFGGDGHVLELGARGLERVGHTPADRAEVGKIRFAPKLVLFPRGVHMEVSFRPVI